MAKVSLHLSRNNKFFFFFRKNNKLFFGCAFFITLALCLYLILIPYFSSKTVFPSPAKVGISSDSCIPFLHRIKYIGVAQHLPNKSWDWVEPTQVSKCAFHKFNRSDVSDLLNGSWIVVAGDSESRLTAISLLISVMESDGHERIRADLFKRHEDYAVTLKDIDMKMDFIWAPFADNFTKYLYQLRQNKTCPDFILVGAQIWEMLDVNNATKYGISLKVLGENVLALLRNCRRSPHFFWIGMPKLIMDLLTPGWSTKLGDDRRYLYENQLMGSKLLSENGGPFFKLDLHGLSDSCGYYCTGDGIHYDEAVYDSAVQIMFNALSIESNRKPR